MQEGVHLYGGFEGNETARDQRDREIHAAVIDGSTARHGLNPAQHVVIGVDNATLDGFTITGGNAIADENGGGMLNRSYSLTVANCTFTGNSADGWGGGMYNSGSITVINCMFSGNSARDGGGIVTVGSATITDCIFTGNSAFSGGGMRILGSPSVTITNCTFADNSADTGGGMANWGNYPTTVTNCTFTGNSATFGGGMHNHELATPTVTNCTFSLNSAGRSGGGMYNSNSEPIVTNSILWGDLPDEVFNDGFFPLITYSLVQGGYDGAGNIDGDPLFWHVAIGDARLQLTSPGVNAGTLAGASSTDIDGVARPQGAGVDLGAYELMELDTDEDGIPDELEGLEDPDGDGVPNQLDTDSDDNGILDANESVVDTDLDEVLDLFDLDDDNDGLTDLDELSVHNSDPKDPDSDDDGLTDYDEVTTHDTDPNVSDSDTDGLSDFEEINEFNTNPNNPDTDGDGASDGVEAAGGGNPLFFDIVTVDPASLTVGVGLEAMVTASSTEPSDTFSWSSSDPEVLTVTPDLADSSMATVTALQIGQATITATGSASGVSGSAEIDSELVESTGCGASSFGKNKGSAGDIIMVFVASAILLLARRRLNVGYPVV